MQTVIHEQNGYIATWAKRWTERPERHQELMERMTAYVCSLSMQRDFGETNEQFAERIPEIAEFEVWFDHLRKGSF